MGWIGYSCTRAESSRFQVKSLLEGPKGREGARKRCHNAAHLTFVFHCDRNNAPR